VLRVDSCFLHLEGSVCAHTHTHVCAHTHTHVALNVRTHINTTYVQVSKLLAGGAAAESGGIFEGDMLQAVDGVDVQLWPLKKLANDMVCSPLNLSRFLSLSFSLGLFPPLSRSLVLSFSLSLTHTLSLSFCRCPLICADARLHTCRSLCCCVQVLLRACQRMYFGPQCKQPFAHGVCVLASDGCVGLQILGSLGTTVVLTLKSRTTGASKDVALVRR